jgi:hypothetical protein
MRHLPTLFCRPLFQQAYLYNPWSHRSETKKAYRWEVCHVEAP